mmetsp:Transcript_95709/g.239801  ORF Transcript_95709/g.239801 Transcript_95709/m.239801 type:complete len:502 (+) Transcript_95709:174-1679(+)
MEEQQAFTGLLKSFSPKDGYGFISCPVLFDAFGRDVYIHQSKLPAGASAGCHVEFTIRISSKGQPRAHRVTLVQDIPDDLDEAANAINKDFLRFAQDTIQYSIELDKKKGNYRLGIDVDTTHGAALLVDAVKGGLVEEWNNQHPQLQVRAGDRIVEVNGITGDAQEILKECQSAQWLNMRIRRGKSEQLSAGSERSVLPTLYVVTWNVLASAYASLKMYPDVDPTILRASRRRAQAAAALAYLAADVICLQEVDCSLAELGLGSEYESCAAQRPEGRCDRCVIAWHKDRLEVGPAGHRTIFFDDDPPPAAFECDPAHYETGNVGIAVELCVRGDPGKRCITVATTHLCWEPHKMDVRAWQLHQFFNMVSSHAGPRILLCGDLNSQPGTQPHQFLAQGCGLVSAYSDVEGVALTNSNAHACSGGFAAMIDYIWYSPKWFSVRKRLELPSSEELKIDGAASTSLADEHFPVPTLLSACWPSDHLALAAVLELTNPVVDDWDFH